MTAPILLLTGIAFVAAVILGIASRIFYVEEDPRIEAVANLLPGANCGGCGQAGCNAAAAAIVNKEIEVNVCVVGGTDTAEAIGAYLGYDVTGAEPSLACSSCEGGYRAARKYNYSGLQDCRAALQLYHGFIRCENGCLGLGSCMRACRFSAISMDPESGLPIFKPDRCVGCGSCVEACPKGIISLIGEKNENPPLEPVHSMFVAVQAALSRPNQYSKIPWTCPKGRVRRRTADHQGEQSTSRQHRACLPRALRDRMPPHDPG